MCATTLKEAGLSVWWHATLVYNRPIAYLRVREHKSRDPFAPLPPCLFFRYLSRVELNVPLKLLTFNDHCASPRRIHDWKRLVLVDGVAEQRSRAGDFAICFRSYSVRWNAAGIFGIFFETVTSIERFREINGRDSFFFFFFLSLSLFVTSFLLDRNLSLFEKSMRR